MSRIITIKATKEGGLKVEALGFKGQGCKAITEAIGAVLGQQGEGTIKAEYFEPEQQNNQGMELNG
jgi:hypothetical protein